MFDARQYRIQSRSADTENRLLWGAAALGSVCIAAVVAALVYATNAPATSPPSGQGASQSAASKGTFRYTREWFQFNRNRRDGESAEDFVYANCMAASAHTSAMRAVGVDPFADVQATLDRHAPKPRPKISDEDACRDASRGFRWERSR